MIPENPFNPPRDLCGSWRIEAGKDAEWKPYSLTTLMESKQAIEQYRQYFVETVKATGNPPSPAYWNQ